MIDLFQSRYKAAIFDLDGVIVDTAKYHFLAWERLAKDLGFVFTIEHNELLKGVSRMKSLDILLDVGKISMSEDEKIKLAEIKNNWYVEYISKINECEILPGAREFLQELKGRGVRVALGSASKNAMLILERLNIIHLFDAIIDGNKVQKAKPDPEVFLLGAKELGVIPEDCVVFEDAIAGIDAAKAARMYAVGIGDVTVLNNADIVIEGLHILVENVIAEV